MVRWISPNTSPVKVTKVLIYQHMWKMPIF
jgi:hypothetical protein